MQRVDIQEPVESSVDAPTPQNRTNSQQDSTSQYRRVLPALTVTPALMEFRDRGRNRSRGNYSSVPTHRRTKRIERWAMRRLEPEQPSRGGQSPKEYLSKKIRTKHKSETSFAGERIAGAEPARSKAAGRRRRCHPDNKSRLGPAVPALPTAGTNCRNEGMVFTLVSTDADNSYQTTPASKGPPPDDCYSCFKRHRLLHHSASVSIVSDAHYQWSLKSTLPDTLAQFHTKDSVFRATEANTPTFPVPRQAAIAHLPQRRGS